MFNSIKDFLYNLYSMVAGLFYLVSVLIGISGSLWVVSLIIMKGYDTYQYNQMNIAHNQRVNKDFHVFTDTYKQLTSQKSTFLIRYGELSTKTVLCMGTNKRINRRVIIVDKERYSRLDYNHKRLVIFKGLGECVHGIKGNDRGKSCDRDYPEWRKRISDTCLPNFKSKYWYKQAVTAHFIGTCNTLKCKERDRKLKINVAR